MKKLVISGKIPLKVLKDPEGKLGNLDVYENIVGYLSTPSDPRVGMTFSDLVSRSKIMQKLEDGKKDAKESVLLEDADYQVLCDCIRKTNFNFAEPALSMWLTDILNAPEVAVTPAKKGAPG